MYQCLPDSSHNAAIVLYEFNAEMARMTQNVDVPLLPRLITRHFKPPWDCVENIVPIFEHDHVRSWRDVGIAGSASLFSITESPPFQHFENGYVLSGAQKPDGVYLIEAVLEQYGMESSEAEKLACEIHSEGTALFFSVRGSVLQIFLRHPQVEELVYLADEGKGANCCNTLTHYGPRALSVLEKDNLDSMQMRLVARPDILLDATKAQIYHYQSNESRYMEAKSKFRQFLRGLLRVERAWVTIDARETVEGDCKEEMFLKTILVRNYASQS